MILTNQERNFIIEKYCNGIGEKDIELLFKQKFHERSDMIGGGKGRTTVAKVCQNYRDSENKKLREQKALEEKERKEVALKLQKVDIQQLFLSFDSLVTFVKQKIKYIDEVPYYDGENEEFSEDIQKLLELKNRMQKYYDDSSISSALVVIEESLKQLTNLSNTQFFSATINYKKDFFSAESPKKHTEHDHLQLLINAPPKGSEVKRKKNLKRNIRSRIFGLQKKMNELTKMIENSQDDQLNDMGNDIESDSDVDELNDEEEEEEENESNDREEEGEREQETTESEKNDKKKNELREIDKSIDEHMSTVCSLLRKRSRLETAKMKTRQSSSIFLCSGQGGFSIPINLKKGIHLHCFTRLLNATTGENLEKSQIFDKIIHKRRKS